MEPSISSLTFKGSVLEAVTEAKKQKKLFVVYVSGDDGDSVHLEQSTWADLNVVNSISKYCIFLHLLQGSVNAVQLSAIYPQKSVPCITAIGYNGVQLWQHEGYISPENLVASIEKTWLSLHIQETTATFLTAALASSKSGTSSSHAPNVALSEARSSYSSDISSSLPSGSLQTPGTKPLPSSEITGETDTYEPRIKNVGSSSQSVQFNALESDQDVKSASSIQPTDTSLKSVAINHNNFEVETGCLTAGGGCADSQVNIALDDQRSKFPGESLQTAKDVEEGVQNKKAVALDGSIDANKSNDILLNIRLPDGSSLQKKFPVTDPLYLVKNYVDKNQTSASGLYDLAIPYPRKIFGEKDLTKALSELELSDRQALIVVPRDLAARSQSGSGQSLSSDQIYTTGNGNESPDINVGYWQYAKKLVSYINPLAYLSSNASISSSERGSAEGLWQYGPNPRIQNQSSGAERPHRMYTPNNSQSGENAGQSRKPSTTSRFGSNIHTLRHEEDDGPSKDRNTFWNGNSTQYGGNDNDK